MRVQPSLIERDVIDGGDGGYITQEKSIIRDIKPNAIGRLGIDEGRRR